VAASSIPTITLPSCHCVEKIAIVVLLDAASCQAPFVLSVIAPEEEDDILLFLG
jgi:hypothetical protein